MFHSFEHQIVAHQVFIAPQGFRGALIRSGWRSVLEKVGGRQLSFPNPLGFSWVTSDEMVVPTGELFGFNTGQFQVAIVRGLLAFLFYLLFGKFRVSQCIDRLVNRPGLFVCELLTIRAS